MIAWQIFWQSVLRVVNNLPAAIRVSLVPSIITGVALVVLWLPIIRNGFDREAMQRMMDAGTFPWLQFLLGAAISAFCGLWTAVSWHRYVLLDEMPGWIPPLRADRMGAYFVRTLLICLILIPVAIGVSLGAGLLLAGPIAAARSGGGSMLLLSLLSALIIILPIWLIGLRLATALAGAAVGAEGGIGEAWRATAGRWGTFAALALLIAIISFVLEYVGSLISGSVPVAIVWQVLTTWASGIVGVSIITTLYGYFVERRSLG